MDKAMEKLRAEILEQTNLPEEVVDAIVGEIASAPCGSGCITVMVDKSVKDGDTVKLPNREQVVDAVGKLANESEKKLAEAGRSGNFYAQIRHESELNAYAKVLGILDGKL